MVSRLEIEGLRERAEEGVEERVLLMLETEEKWWRVGYASFMNRCGCREGELAPEWSGDAGRVRRERLPVEAVRVGAIEDW